MAAPSSKFLVVATLLLVGLIAIASIGSVSAVKWHTGRGYTHPNEPNCGPAAPRIDGEVAGCNPNDPNYNCCSPAGYCGTGPDYCK